MEKKCEFCGTINDTHHSAECIDTNGKGYPPQPAQPEEPSLGELNTELYDSLDEWFASLDLLMKLNDCILSELIGSEDRDLRRIYKAYQAIKAMGLTTHP